MSSFPFCMLSPDRVENPHRLSACICAPPVVTGGTVSRISGAGWHGGSTHHYANIPPPRKSSGAAGGRERKQDERALFFAALGPHDLLRFAVSGKRRQGRNCPEMPQRLGRGADLDLRPHCICRKIRLSIQDKQALPNVLLFESHRENQSTRILVFCSDFTRKNRYKYNWNFFFLPTLRVCLHFKRQVERLSSF